MPESYCLKRVRSKRRPDDGQEARQWRILRVKAQNAVDNLPKQTAATATTTTDNTNTSKVEQKVGPVRRKPRSKHRNAETVAGPHTHRRLSSECILFIWAQILASVPLLHRATMCVCLCARERVPATFICYHVYFNDNSMPFNPIGRPISVLFTHSWFNKIFVSHPSALCLSAHKCTGSHSHTRTPRVPIPHAHLIDAEHPAIRTFVILIQPGQPIWFVLYVRMCAGVARTTER